MILKEQSEQQIIRMGLTTTDVSTDYLTKNNRKYYVIEKTLWYQNKNSKFLITRYQEKNRDENILAMLK